MGSRILTAAIYGLLAAAAVVQAHFPQSGQEWASVIGAFAIAAWGKYSHPDTALAANVKP